MELELRINGVTADQDVAPNESLLSLLRREGYYSVKQGCGTGDCGACTVLVDGVPRPSCVMLAAQAGGCSLTTTESLGSADNLHPLQAAFIEVGAAQCGFCTSGMLLSAYALLKSNPNPTEEEVRDALSGNICRCSGYSKPVQAVMRTAALIRGEKLSPLTQKTVKAKENVHSSDTSSNQIVRNLVAKAAATASNRGGVTTKIPVITPEMASQPAPTPVPPPMVQFQPQLQVVGKPLAAIKAAKHAMGKSSFVDDIAPRGLLHARLLTSPHAHAVIRNISVNQAKALPGVLAVLTYKDVARIPFSSVERLPGENTLQDQYCLDYTVRYVGDRVAAVVAETPEVAEQALRLIEVDYEVQPAVLDVRQASDSAAPRVHSETEARGIYDAARNIAARVRTEVGDVERAFSDADHIVEAEYSVPATLPTPLEPHTVITYFDENDVLVVRTNSQVPHHIRRTLARLLNLPIKRIRVVQPEVGGSFGARQEFVFEDICALFTVTTKRPVRLSHAQAEQLEGGRLRQQHILRLKTGVKRDGKIVANQMVLLADTGAYGTHALTTEAARNNALALYPCPNTRFVAEVLYTNHPPAGALPGYELAPEFFALESHMDDVARQLGIDVLVFRRKNMLKDGNSYPLPSGSGRNREANVLIENCGLAACLQTVEEKIGWSEKRGRANYDRFRHGVGIALSFHGNPGGNDGTSGAMMQLNEDGSFDVFASHNENGSGLTTVLAQIAAEVLGVSVSAISVHTTDTTSSPFEFLANDFSAFYSCGGAVKKAAEQTRRQVLSVAGRMLNALPESLKMHDGIIKAANGQQVTIAQVAEHSLYIENRQIMTTSSWKAQSVPMAFSAHAAEVELDMETGGVRIVKVVTAVDVGQAINPLLLEAQIEGMTTQALGMSLCDEMFYDQSGVLLTTNFHDYHLLSAVDMPPLETYLVETASSSELFGAKSSGTVALYSLPAAIANAILDAADIRIRQTPMTPERALRAIHALMAKNN